MSIPAYVRIRDYVEGEIQRANGEVVKLLTSKELCVRFGVSRQTVHKALREFTKSGALVSRQGLGTFVNTDSTGTVSEGVPKTLAIEVINQSGRNIYLSGYVARFFAGAAGVFAEAMVKYRLVSPAGRGEKAAAEILSNRPDGVLWICPTPDKDCFGAIEAVQRAGLPLMAITTTPSFYFNGLNYVDLDFEEGGYLAAKYLLSAGHERIVFAALENNYDPNRNAYQGFLRAHAERGLQHDERLLLHVENQVSDEINNFIKYGVPFSAVFTLLSFFREIAAALTRHHLTVPGNIAMVTQYGPETKLFPGIAPLTLNEPLHEMGQLAAEQLLALIHGEAQAPLRTTLKPVLVSGA
jgi:DNA-binding LacI/PurR family transcriptional regulator